MGADSSLDEALGSILNKALEMDIESEEPETPIQSLEVNRDDAFASTMVDDTLLLD